LDMTKIQNSLKLTNAELKQYYQENIDNYTLPAKWHVAQILIKLPSEATDQQVSEGKAKIDGIAKKIGKGANFSALAKTESQDIGSAKKGGVLPWFSIGMIGPKFEKTVMQLKPGEVSQPVRTKYGFNIIKFACCCACFLTRIFSIFCLTSAKERIAAGLCCFTRSTICISGLISIALLLFPWVKVSGLNAAAIILGLAVNPCSAPLCLPSSRLKSLCFVFLNLIPWRQEPSYLDS